MQRPTPNSIRLVYALAWCLAGALPCPAQDGPAFEPLRVTEEVVGVLSNPERITFEGLQSFTAESVREQLMTHPRIIAASNPLKPRRAYLDLLRDQMVKGLQFGGFPEPVVEVSATEESILVRVREGERFRNGPVVVTGAEAGFEMILSNRLTQGWSPAQAVMPDADQAVSSDMIKQYTASMLGEDLSTPALWNPDRPVEFQRSAKEQLQRDMEQIMGQLGYSTAVFTTRIVPQPGRGMAELRVEFEEGGRRDVLDRVVLKGNTRNSRDSILKLLDLKDGVPVTPELLGRVERRLWQCARFHRHRASLLPLRPGHVELLIEVTELDDIPTLEEALSPAQQTLLRLHDWVLQAMAGGEDLVISMTFPALPGQSPLQTELVLSRAGFLVAMGDPDSTLPEHMSLAVMLSQVGGELFCPRQKRKLNLGSTNAHLVGRLYFTANSDAESDNRWSFNFSGGMGSLKRDEAAPPFELELLLSPAATLGTEADFESVREEGGQLVLAKGPSRLVVDQTTGRLVEFRWENEEGAAIRAKFKPGALEDQLRRFRQVTADHEDVAEGRGLATGLARMIYWEWMRGDLLPRFFPVSTTPVRDREQAAHVVDGLLARGLLSDLDRLLNEFHTLARERDGFALPRDDVAVPNSMTGLLVGWMSVPLMKLSHELFPNASWPQEVLRLVVLTAFQEVEEANEQVRSLQRTQDMGPVACYVSARVLGLLDPAMAQAFVEMGEQRMELSGLKRDMRTLLQPGSELLQAASSWDQALQGLSDEDLKLLIQTISGPMGDVLRLWRRDLRQARATPLQDRLPEWLDVWWEESLREQLGQAYKRLAQPAAQAAQAQALLEAALKQYEGRPNADYPRAAELAREAAELGHPGAQYLLGKMYQDGQGVPRSDEQALLWFVRSAENGFAASQFMLGEMYTDGFSLPLNRVEGSVFYALAALQGNKAAAVLFRLNFRKLDKDGQAKVAQRLTQILKRPFENLEEEVNSATP